MCLAAAMIDMEALPATPIARGKVVIVMMRARRPRGYRSCPHSGISLREELWHQHSRLRQAPLVALEGYIHFRIGSSARQALNGRIHSDRPARSSLYCYPTVALGRHGE